MLACARGTFCMAAPARRVGDRLDRNTCDSPHSTPPAERILSPRTAMAGTNGLQPDVLLALSIVWTGAGLDTPGLRAEQVCT